MKATSETNGPEITFYASHRYRVSKLSKPDFQISKLTFKDYTINRYNNTENNSDTQHENNNTIESRWVAKTWWSHGWGTVHQIEFATIVCMSDRL